MSSRRMALTPDLVARVHRVVEDSGPLPGLAYHTEADYDAAVQDMLSSYPRGEDLYQPRSEATCTSPWLRQVASKWGWYHTAELMM